MQHAVIAISSNGSMWMSEAWVSTARVISRLTSRMTGASLAKSFSRSASSSNGASPSGTAWFSSGYSRFNAASNSIGTATSRRTARPVAMPTAAGVKGSSGSAVVRVKEVASAASGTALACRRKAAVRRSGRIGSNRG